MPKKDTREMDVGQESSIELPVDGPIGILEESGFESVDTPRFKAKADAAMFFEKPIQVRINQTSDENEELFVSIGNNGTKQRIQRGGDWQTIKLKYALTLARAKVMKPVTEEYQNFKQERAIRIRKRMALQYPFEYQSSDPNVMAYMNKVMQEA
jgi:3-methyladenine DNA glycosylase AlkC